MNKQRLSVIFVICKMKFCVLLPLLTIGLSLSGTVRAQLITDPSTIANSGTNQYNLYLGQSETAYEIKKTGNDELTRSVFAGSYARGLNTYINLYLAGTYAFDVHDGTGYELAIGGKGKLPYYQTENVSINWYSQYSAQFDELGEAEEITVENKLGELLIGFVGNKTIDADLSFYAGLEFVVDSTGETISKKDFLDNFVSDITREKTVGLRIGAKYKNFQMHIGLIDETSVLVGVSLPIEGLSLSLPSWPKKVKTPIESETIPDESTSVPADKVQPNVIPTTDPITKPEETIRNTVSKKKRQAEIHRNRLIKLQEELALLGYEPGPVDGKIGKKSRAAIKSYQIDNGLNVNGNPTEETLKKLGIE